jgi:DNA polymerase V
MAKAGVILLDLISATVQQPELKLEPGRKKDRTMAAMDDVNGRYRKDRLRFGSTGTRGSNPTWTMKQKRRTPEYTRRLKDVPVART